MPADERPQAALIALLASGSVEIEGRMPWSSNNTFLVTVCPGVDDGAEAADPTGPPEPGAADGTGPDGPTEPAAPTDPTDPAGPAAGSVTAIYKPGRGERPLWDFPDGLYRREVAAFELSEALGWGFIPPTVEREDGPLGPGSLQLFVDADFEQHYFTLLEDEAHHRALKRMATFDALANNADRKGGHCLIDAAGRIWGIDHGLCFHVQQKLRTVIWDFAGDPVEDDDLADIGRLLDGGLPDRVGRFLHDEERRALLKRARRLLDDSRLPEPRTDHPYPWPLV